VETATGAGGGRDGRRVTAAPQQAAEQGRAATRGEVEPRRDGRRSRVAPRRPAATMDGGGRSSLEAATRGKNRGGDARDGKQARRRTAEGWEKKMDRDWIRLVQP